MAGIGILGYGTVGSGVYEVLKVNSEIISRRAGEKIEVKRIFDLRDFADDEVQKILTHDFEDILNDKDIDIVAEVMGGVEPAFTYSIKAMEMGKSVVTSNKALVAEKGPELLKSASKNGVNFMFEASCGGTIPVIRPLNEALTADEILKIEGILNGTTNFILSKMTAEGKGFAEVLKLAQSLGYAEADPTADVEGYDACRKIAILSSVAFGGTVEYKKILTEGITKITKTDIAYAKAVGSVIKLVASSEITENGVSAKVTPLIIRQSHPLACVNDAYNAIFVRGNMSGETMYYGSGAGKLPTAAAVVGDIIDEVKHKNCHKPIDWDTDRNLTVLSTDELTVKGLIRVAFADDADARRAVSCLFGTKDFVQLADTAGEFAFLTDMETEKSLKDKVFELSNNVSVKEILNVIRVEE
ncbi:homoserine dehydrogenase [Lachnospiraceae bacterium NSJ-143]|nr:homoserine dehydrogenase [Lachnospiraceae bacterium NSJ-143]